MFWFKENKFIIQVNKNGKQNFYPIKTRLSLKEVDKAIIAAIRKNKNSIFGINVDYLIREIFAGHSQYDYMMNKYRNKIIDFESYDGGKDFAYVFSIKAFTILTERQFFDLATREN